MLKANIMSTAFITMKLMLIYTYRTCTCALMYMGIIEMQMLFHFFLSKLCEE